ncbi:hypothetical protein [Pseudorhodoferax sp.]|uniref:hypothetical protein n=1 Tax=Pseudorhodoferax sp. TaxID=1993553 RepID=UPI0039E61AEB
MRADDVKRSILAAAACAAAASMTACGGGDDSRPAVTVGDLPAGVHMVSTGNADQPTVGRYYASADGKRLLVLEDDHDAASLLLRRPGGGSPWVAVPEPQADLDVQFLRSQAVAAATPALPALAGRYVVRLSDGSAADFRIGTDGRLTAGTLSRCQLSGTLAAGALPGTLSATLAARDCPGLPASATGVLVQDPSDAPAALRLLADDGSRLVDLRGYGEPGA